MKFLHISGKSAILYSIMAFFQVGVKLLMKFVHISGKSAILYSLLAPFHGGVELLMKTKWLSVRLRNRWLWVQVQS